MDEEEQGGRKTTDICYKLFHFMSFVSFVNELVWVQKERQIDVLSSCN